MKVQFADGGALQQIEEIRSFSRNPMEGYGPLVPYFVCFDVVEGMAWAFLNWETLVPA